ncbi:MAG: VWA domain-containing protein, partial [Acidobacteriota bacterium]
MRMTRGLWFSLAVLATIAASAAVAPAVRGRNPAQTQPQQDPQDPSVIKVGTALVTLPVIVTDRFGQFVSGLAQRDFSVSEDGVRQEISTFTSTEAPFDVALLIDTSHSTQRKLSAIRKAALTFVKQLQPKDRVMIVTFDENVRFVSDLTSDRVQLKQAIESVKSGFATSLYDAIVMTVREKLAPLSGRKALVVLSDGVDTASKMATYESTLDLISTAGVIAYAIQYETRNDGGPILKPLSLPGPVSSFPVPESQFPVATFEPGGQAIAADHQGPIPPAVWRFNQTGATGAKPPQPARDRYLIARDFLRALVLQSGARYHQAETIESTSYAFEMIANELRHQYTIAYYSSNEKHDGRLRAV